MKLQKEMIIMRKKLVDEIGILKNLEHPNIMKIYECFDDKENVYIISEYCDEGDLNDFINREYGPQDFYNRNPNTLCFHYSDWTYGCSCRSEIVWFSGQVQGV